MHPLHQHGLRLKSFCLLLFECCLSCYFSKRASLKSWHHAETASVAAAAFATQASQRCGAPSAPPHIQADRPKAHRREPGMPHTKEENVASAVQQSVALVVYEVSELLHQLQHCHDGAAAALFNHLARCAFFSAGSPM
jgi:hypothetical protein